MATAADINSGSIGAGRASAIIAMVVTLTAFLPHSERALIFSNSAAASGFAAQTLGQTVFSVPASSGPIGGLGAVPIGFGASGPDRTARAPRLAAIGNPGTPPILLAAVPTSAAAPPALVPLGGSGTPALASLPSGGSSGGASSSGGATGSSGGAPGGGFPSLGGGSSGGGGSISSGPVTPPVVTPPIVTPVIPGVPEPGVWAMLIVGFGVIGSALRRQRRQISAATAG